MIKFITTALLWFVNLFVNGYVLWRLWEWFIAVPPLYAPHITFWHAWAIGLFGSWLGVLTIFIPEGTKQSSYRHANIMLTAKSLSMGLIYLNGLIVHTWFM